MKKQIRTHCPQHALTHAHSLIASMSASVCVFCYDFGVRTATAFRRNTTKNNRTKINTLISIYMCIVLSICGGAAAVLWLHDSVGQPVCDYQKSLLAAWIEPRVHWTPIHLRFLRHQYVARCVCVRAVVSLCVFWVDLYRHYCYYWYTRSRLSPHFDVEMNKVYSRAVGHLPRLRHLPHAQSETEPMSFARNCLKTRWILFHRSFSKHAHEYRLNFVRFVSVFDIPFHSYIVENSLALKDSLTCEMNSHFFCLASVCVCVRRIPTGWWCVDKEKGSFTILFYVLYESGKK